MDKEIILDYTRFILEGNHYDIGQSIGRNLKQYKEWYNYTIMPECLDEKTIKQKQKLMDEFCPGIFEEISGLADSLNVPIGKIKILSDDCINAGACSQFAVMPNITANGQILLGRSYEYSIDDELCLSIVRAKGKPAHIGFSILIFGRFDGINEHGLVVSMSSCEFRQKPTGRGFWFPLVLRALLDNCKIVDEAVYLLNNIPVRSNINVLLADKTGNATIAEMISINNDKKISFRKNDEYLIATNHYMNEDMIKYENNRGRHSVLRYKTIENQLNEKSGTISIDTIKTILEHKVPNGVFCPYYEDYLGTLHSMVFNVSNTDVEVCFGMPSRNKWEQINFNSPTKITKQTEIIKNEFPDNPALFWSNLPTGSMEI